MRPLELRLRNFRSFYGEGHTFDFRDRRLIGIVGPIGSGKSTLLDAVAFALYGRTPRIGLATKSLIHQRAGNGAVSLRFDVEGEVWEAVRNLRRKGASQHALYRLPDDVSDFDPAKDAVEKILLERDVNARIEDLLGLDYQGFGRSVLLAQGQFADFLNAKPAERDKVLKGVFGYERIDEVRELAKRKAGRARHEIEKLDIRLENARKVRERLAELRKDLAEAVVRFENLEAARPAIEELAGRISAAEESRKKAQTRLKELRGQAGKLPDQDAGNRDIASAGQAKGRLAAAEKQLEEAEDRLAEAEAAVASEEFQQRESGWRQASDLAARLEGRMEAADRASKETDRAAEAVDKGEQAVEEAGSAVEAARSELDAAETDARQAESALRLAEGRLQEALQAADLAARLEDRVKASGQASEAAARAARDVEESERLVEVNRSAVEAARSGLDAAETDARQAESALRLAEGRLQEARHADMAGSLRDRLAVGDACPVCEQPVHEVPQRTDRHTDTDTARVAVEGARSGYEAAGEGLLAAKGRLEGARAAFVASSGGLEGARGRLSDARLYEREQQGRLDILRGEIRGLLGEGDPAEHLTVERAACGADTARVAVEGARSGYEAAGEGLLAAKGRLEGARAAFVASSGGLEGARGRLSDARLYEREQQGRLDILRGEIRGLLGEGDPAERLAAERAVLDVSHRKVEEARKLREGALKARGRAVGEEQKAQRRLSDLRTRIGALAASLQTGLEVPDDDPEAVRSALAALHTEWKRVSSDLERAMGEHRARIETDAERMEELRAEHHVAGSIEEALAAVGATRDHLEKGIELAEKQLAGVEDLKAERRRRKDQERLNGRLASDLTNAKFIRFLLDEERARLAGLGSEHFERLSSGRYRFTEDGEFHVVDLNAAEAIRRADSLSGGETFLASLGLALGLAEMVGRRGGRLDAFFLDEGFGALDPEHLDLAMEGIESLVADREQRLVVVVSHVPEVRRRVEDLIELGNEAATGDSKVMSGGAR